MEYINLSSLAREVKTPEEICRELLVKYDPITPADQLIVTDDMELLRGGALVQTSLSQGVSFLPCRRVSYIKQTKNFPKRVLLELTSECNSFCTMCPRNELVRPKMHLETHLAKKVIHECTEHGISGLWLYYIGESLLHPDFFEILEFCRKYDSLGPLWLSTNGELLDEQMREKILDQPVDVLNYSVNAMSEENYKRVTPLLNFHRVQQNLKSLTMRKLQRRMTKPMIRAQMIEIPYVLDEIEAFIKEYGDKVDMISIIKMELFSRTLEGSIGNAVNKRIPKCNRLEREDFFIFSDGSVTCCDTDFNCTLNLGNVKNQTVKEIYDGNKYQNLIMEYRAGRLHEQHICSTCHDYNL